MRISLKAGSSFKMPFSGDFFLRSSNPAVLKVDVTPAGIVITAVAPGSTSLLLTLGSDFVATLLVDVTAA